MLIFGTWYRFLSGDDLVGVIGKIHHSERYYAKQQADYALSEVCISYILDHLCLKSNILGYRDADQTIFT